MKDVYQSLTLQFEALKNNINESGLNQKSWFNASEFFNAGCFACHSEELKDYLSELEQQINKLKAVSSIQYAEHLTITITEQFSCFRSLLNSFSVNEKHKSYKAKNRTRLQKVKSLTRQVTQSSQELYQELSQLQDYERRLLEMVNNKQQTLNQYSGQKHKNEYQQQVLLTQQRLGRCRQAISKVEEQIQRLDNRD